MTLLGARGLWWSNVLNSVFPPQRLRPYTRLEHQDPVSHTVQKKREKERKEGREGRKERRKEGRKRERKKD